MSYYLEKHFEGFVGVRDVTVQQVAMHGTFKGVSAFVLRPT